MRASQHRRHVLEIMGLTLLLIVLMVAWGLSVYHRFAAVNTLWTEFNEQRIVLRNELAMVSQNIGYGGFIHNYMHYVLRQDTAYEPIIENNLNNLFASLDRLEPLLQVSEEIKGVATIRATIEEYQQNYRTAQKMVRSGLDAKTVEQLVKVDDKPALAALAHINAQLSRRSQWVQQQAMVAMREAGERLLLGVIGVPLVLSIAALLLFFMRRLVAANEEACAARNESNALIETAPDPMITVGVDGLIQRANTRAVDYFGYSLPTMIGMEIERLVPVAKRTAHVEHRKGFFAQPKHRQMGMNRQLQVLLANGQERDVEIGLSYCGTGASALATITLRDVTRQNQIQGELLTAKAGAEAALVELKQMQESMVQSQKLAALGGLVAGVAHEVNTPVGNMLSAATHLEKESRQVAERYQQGELSGDELESYFTLSAEAIRLMIVNSQRAAELVQSFKQVAVDQTGGERRRFELREYLNEIVLSLRPKFKHRKIECVIDCPVDLRLDTLPGALAQVLTNLIVNALTHAYDQDQEGTLRLTGRQLPQDQVELVFADDGKGIPPALQQKVFEPFFTTQRSQGGSGLGLHIVYNLVHNVMRGTLRMESRERVGTTFTLRFPRVLPGSLETRL